MPIRNNRFKEFGQAIHEEQRKRLERAAIVVQRRAKENLSVSGTGVRSKTGAVVRAIKRTKATIYGAFPSLPGESPHKQTGNLRMSVTRELVRKLNWVARVGTNVWYGWFLEAKRDRPWLVKSLNQELSRVRAILTAPFKWN